jgi:hypothetical protein
VCKVAIDGCCARKEEVTAWMKVVGDAYGIHPYEGATKMKC